MKFWLVGALGALVLAGCASKQALVPQVQQGKAQDGSKTVSVAPEKTLCSRPQCPVLAASWTSAKDGQAVLTIGLPYQQAAVTGADFHFGSQEIVRVRSRSQTAALAQDFPATAFDVPLRTVERIAYGPSSWVRVYTEGGASVDETINSGEEGSRAFTAMHYFMGAVQAATGKGPSDDVNAGGLMDRLGMGRDDKDKQR
ncbi:hypothetical protein [Comamonas sp. GB3 AK4-5]|uniref:hypothetical protein n=1 Tax=Comamonas sp. GB3 AK4-5 TaxID=3231487 RepID=UPI00351EB50E